MKHRIKHILAIVVSLVISIATTGCSNTAKHAIYLDFAGVNAAISQ